MSLARNLMLSLALTAALPVAAEPRFAVRDEPLPVSAPAGQVEVIEFFSWGCPACYRTEAPLQAWLNATPGIAFRRVPATFDPVFARLAPAYYVAESLGVTEKISDPIFAALHDPAQRGSGLFPALQAYRRAETQREGVEPAKQAYEQAMAALFQQHAGVEPARFRAAWYSPAVRVKLAEGERLFRTWKVGSVPSFAVDGRFLAGADPALDVRTTDDVLTAMQAAVAEARRARR